MRLLLTTATALSFAAALALPAPATAGIFATPLTESCKQQTALAVKYEGTGALGESFKVLGEIAMGTLLAHPKVAAQLQEFVKHVDTKKLEAVFAEPAAGG